MSGSRARVTEAERRPVRVLAGPLLALLAACTEPQVATTMRESDGGAPCDIACDAATDASGDDDARAEGGQREMEADASPLPTRQDGANGGFDAALAEDGSAHPEGGSALSGESARALLLGKYAVRARFYGKDLATGSLFLSQEITWLADITDGERGALQLVAQICEDHGEGTGALPKIRAAVKYPEKTAPRSFELVLEGEDGFRTRGEPYLIGYTAEPPAGCVPGQTLSRPSGVCLCPSSDTPPLRANDCRVYDSDEDGEPGYSVELMGFINRTDHVRHKDMSQMVRGKISAQKKHTAIYQYNHDHRTLECGMLDCPVSEYEPCLVDESHVLFEPLAPLTPSGAAWTCPEIVRKSVAGEFSFPQTSLARSCQ